MLLALDLSALNVILPSIERDLDVNLRTAQWAVNAYLLTYGMTIVTGGRLADELGRRKVFAVGTALFAAMALVCWLAPDIYWLIAARAIMGIASGLMLPAITGMAFSLVAPQRGATVGGFITGAYGLGMAAGPLLGGGLTELIGWRWTQFIDVPIALLGLLAVWLSVPQPPSARSRSRVDLPGILTLSVALVALLLAIDQGAQWGWDDWRIRGGLIAAGALFAAFVLIERRTGEMALIPSDIVRIPRIALVCALKVLFAPAYSASLFFLPQIMQKTLGFAPFKTGTGMLPMLGTYAIVSFLVGIVGHRLPARYGMVAGLAGVAVGTFLISRFNAAAGFLALAPGMALIGIGLGLFQPSSVTEAVEADDRGRKSLASGLAMMSQYVGGALGLGVTATIVAASERSAVDAQLANVSATLVNEERAALDKILVGAESAQAVLAQFGPDIAGQLLEAAREAFVAGVQTGLRLDAALAGLACVLAILALSRRRPAVPATSGVSSSDRVAANRHDFR